jgi:general secretion pathway protein G
MVELVVVVLVLGIIAAIAAPKFFNTAGDARDSGTKQNLAVIRDALELYKSQTGAYPAQATVTADLEDYIRGPFPAPEVGGNKGDANVADSAEDPIATVPVAGGAGWVYNETTGEFRVNDGGYLAW